MNDEAGADAGAVEDIVADEDLDVLDEDEHDDTVMGEDVALPAAEPDLEINPNDPIPAAGIADIGGRAGGVN